MEFINDYRKVTHWTDKNFFFITTIFIAVLNIILYAALGGWGSSVKTNGWHAFIHFDCLVHTFLNAFSHSNWQHTLLNMLCFVICGIYLERKTGSLYFLLLILSFAFFGGCAVAANNNSIAFHGFSGVNYSLYAYVLIDFIFIIVSKKRRNKFRLINGGIMLALIYLAACFNGGTSSFSFSWYPYDMMYNLGHYTSCLTGLLIALAIKLFPVVCAKKYADER